MKTSQELLSKHENLIEELKIAHKHRLSKKIINGLYSEIKQFYTEVYARKKREGFEGSSECARARVY